MGTHLVSNTTGDYFIIWSYLLCITNHFQLSVKAEIAFNEGFWVGRFCPVTVWIQNGGLYFFFFFLPLHRRAEYTCKLIWTPRRGLLHWHSSIWYLFKVFDSRVLSTVMLPWHDGFCVQSRTVWKLCPAEDRLWEYTQGSRPIHTVLLAHLNPHVGTACKLVWEQPCSWPLLSH